MDNPHFRTGVEITPQRFTPDRVQLFRFSAATWNPHRIHYDQAHARDEGYPDVLIQSHLHAGLLLKTLMDWAGPNTRVRRFRWENRAVATPGDVLTCSGKVVAVHRSLDEPRTLSVDCELLSTTQRDDVCAPAWATLEIVQ